MIRSELVDVVYRSHGGLSREEAQELLDLILGVISSRLARGERVLIAGFGTFDLVLGGPREGRHPVTGRRFRVPAGQTLQFRPSRQLTRQLNGNTETQA